ncbi:AMP-binding protein [Planococcus lenghuensis]|uniref:AMP-dependent synthetase n=1 Tax=Planococcus lenghuensis TaxID=2213202 RepID=A0A1Q2L2J3_9BACL|nr:AMP-binding protein [Planococcus lenghuensis]AQQ54102.1 AMP-dependent synthetase [Planococcus lenghuensis]
MPENLTEQVNQWIDEYDRQIPSVAHLLCDRHDPNKRALVYENTAGDKRTYTYGELQKLSRKFASVLQNHGVEKGQRVAVLLPKGPELLISVLAIWRIGAVHVPLFTAFGPQAISYRAGNSGARVIITDGENREKLNGTEIEAKANDTGEFRIITVTSKMEEEAPAKDTHFWNALGQAAPIEENAEVTGEDLFILLYTSGTTGHPKGVEVPVKALASFEGYMRFGLDLRQDDIFWNIADPGWAYGLYYALVGPLLLGQTFIMYNAKFSVDEAYRVLKEYGVTNYAAAPTVYRSMRATGVPEGLKEELKVRVLSSAGEPLNPDVSTWAEAHLGVPVYDHYGQTEQGMVVNNHHHPALQRPVKAGSMGQSMPGFQVAIVDESGTELPPGEEGQLAIDTDNSPFFWFRGYYRDEERTRERFVAGSRYYLTGDAASRDEEDFIYFSGRSDDIISSAGYRIGPFEVESALMGHEAVAEAAVIGVPDEQRGEVVKAYVVLRSGFAASDELSNDLSQFVKRNLSAHEYPREIEFVDVLPKTPSGKIQRFQLRGQ